MSEATSPDPGAPASGGGKPIVIVVVVLVVGVMALIGGVGYHHATRNRRRHEAGSRTGGQLYGDYCARCHMPDLRGNSAYPGLITRDYDLGALREVLNKQSNAMPSFAGTFDEQDIERLRAFLAEQRAAATAATGG